MVTKNPRVNVTLSKDDLKVMAMLAKKYNKSLSLTARELIEQALETHEDIFLHNVARERDNETKKWLTDAEFWKL